MLLRISLLFAGFCVVDMQNLEVLTNNFFENLKVAPNLIAENDFRVSKRFVDTQIENYIRLVTGEEFHSVKKKRSLLDKFIKNEKGIYLLHEIKPSATIPAKFPKDIVMFEQNSTYFAAALESVSPSEGASTLAIYKFENETFVEKSRISTINGTKLATIAFENSTLLAIAENDSPKINFNDKSGIYQFDASGLIKIQSIDMHYAMDIVLWRIHNEIYMSVAQFMSNHSRYEIELPIYKWLGKHFDLVQKIPSKGARKITPFSIENANFLAVANSRDDKGNHKIYSEIYKYDYHAEKFELYQRILTNACADIQVFTFVGTRRPNGIFLAVANFFEKDFDNINYETNSIIYKWVDNYFIPFQSLKLNGIQQWLPIQGFKNEFILFATCFDGLKAFQYNGWSFEEVTQKKSEILRGPGIQSLRVSSFNNTLTIVVSNKKNNGKVPNVFRLEFIYENTFGGIYDEMIIWCQNGLNRVGELSQGDLFETVLGKPERADIDEEIEKAQSKEIGAINTKIESLELVLDQLDPVKNLEEIRADEIIFNDVNFTHNINTTNLNNFNIDDLLENTLNIDEGFEIESISFSSIKINESLHPTTINGYDSKSLLHNGDSVTLDQLTVVGTVAAQNTETKGTLNGLKINQLLLKSGDQNFSRPLLMKEAKIDKLRVGTLNNKLESEEPIENLRVTNLTIAGYINDVDIPALDKFALKKTGDQKITEAFIFETLEGNNLEVTGTISGKNVSDLVSIDGGNYTINQDIIFKGDLKIDDLQVTDSFNGITIDDILLKNHSKEQEITGVKIFEDVIIYHAIYLQGRINSKNLEKMNPVVSISDNVFLQGDKTIVGEVQIEDLLSVNNIITPDATYSLTKLKKEGLRLSSREVVPHLQFGQQLNVNEIFVDKINEQSPRNFVVTGSEDSQIIEASKTFMGDLRITGATNALKINSVDVEELENRVLRVDGNQTITGKHHVKHVTTNTISSNTTKFDANASISSTSDKVTINGNFETDLITTKNVTLLGLINELNVTKIVGDTVTKDSKRVIKGHKFFTNLTIGSLDVDTGIAFDEIPNQITLEGPFSIKNIKIERLYFKNQCNAIDRENFGREDSNGTIFGNHRIDSIVVFGNAYIASGKINDVDVNILAEETVKIDEPFEFDSAFIESPATDQVQLRGNLENLDLENLLLSNDTDLTILDEKNFNNVTINGTVYLEALINDWNLTQFCRFASGEIDLKNMTIKGDAFFGKGPNIAKINGVDIANILENAWFSNQNTTLTGSVEFEDVIFENDVEVTGFVDNISLTLLHENYFSKNKDQNVTATFIFANDLVFENDLTVPQINMNHAMVNGIDLDEFVRTALLNDYDQIFETPVFFENCYVKNLTGDFLVNGLDLNKDVMRYDKVNMVTGVKSFENLNADYLQLEKNIKIQDVDVLDWFKYSVLKTTGYNVTGTKGFSDVIFKRGLQLEGSLNDQKFDKEHVMLKNVPQNITGMKTIHTNPLNPVIFKGIKLKGSLNGVDVSDLINNQAHKNQDNTFKTSVNFYNNITTKNLVINKFYEGVNMSELITNVTNLGFLNNLVKQYQNLLDMSYKLKESIQGQAHFMHHYKIIQTIPFVDNSRKILCPDGITRLGVLVPEESSTRIDLYNWQDQEEQFIKNATIKFVDHPDYVDQVLMGRYLYSEGAVDDQNFGHFARISSENTVTVRTNLTTFTTSFTLPTTQHACTLFIYYNSQPRIFCEKKNNVETLQVLESPEAYKASSILIKGTLYLIITQLESGIDLWKFNNESAKFEKHQSLFLASPKSIATTNYNGFDYLAVASAHVQNAMYSGRVEVYRFDETTSRFRPWQSLRLDAPIQVDFSILPSEELVMYVLTDNPTEPLLVFRYEGIAGFRLGITGSALPEIMYVNQFEGAAGQHFIVAQSRDEINVIQAVFKGEKA